MWNAGIQMVAINFQKPGIINTAKPADLQTSESRPPPPEIHTLVTKQFTILMSSPSPIAMKLHSITMYKTKICGRGGYLRTNF